MSGRRRRRQRTKKLATQSQKAITTKQPSITHFMRAQQVLDNGIVFHSKIQQKIHDELIRNLMLPKTRYEALVDAMVCIPVDEKQRLDKTVDKFFELKAFAIQQASPFDQRQDASEIILVRDDTDKWNVIFDVGDDIKYYLEPTAIPGLNELLSLLRNASETQRPILIQTVQLLCQEDYETKSFKVLLFWIFLFHKQYQLFGEKVQPLCLTHELTQLYDDRKKQIAQDPDLQYYFLLALIHRIQFYDEKQCLSAKYIQLKRAVIGMYDMVSKGQDVFLQMISAYRLGLLYSSAFIDREKGIIKSHINMRDAIKYFSKVKSLSTQCGEENFYYAAMFHLAKSNYYNIENTRPYKINPIDTLRKTIINFYNSIDFFPKAIAYLQDKNKLLLFRRLLYEAIQSFFERLNMFISQYKSFVIADKETFLKQSVNGIELVVSILYMKHDITKKSVSTLFPESVDAIEKECELSFEKESYVFKEAIRSIKSKEEKAKQNADELMKMLSGTKPTEKPKIKKAEKKSVNLSDNDTGAQKISIENTVGFQQSLKNTFFPVDPLSTAKRFYSEMQYDKAKKILHDIYDNALSEKLKTDVCIMLVDVYKAIHQKDRATEACLKVVLHCDLVLEKLISDDKLYSQYQSHREFAYADYKKLLLEQPLKREIFSMPLPPIVSSIASHLHAEGYACFLVGGIVRKAKLGMKITDDDDYDIVTDAPVGKLKVSLRDFDIKEYGQDNMVPVIAEGVTLEFFSRPSIKETGLRHDAMGRDFTINALYYSFDTGEILYPYPQSYFDIKHVYLDTIQDSNKLFSENPSAILRYIRFSSSIQSVHSNHLICSSVKTNREKLKKQKKGRFYCELMKMIKEGCFIAALEKMHYHGILSCFFPKAIIKTLNEQQYFYLAQLNRSLHVLIAEKTFPSHSYLLPFLCFLYWPTVMQQLNATTKSTTEIVGSLLKEQGETMFLPHQIRSGVTIALRFCTNKHENNKKDDGSGYLSTEVVTSVNWLKTIIQKIPASEEQVVSQLSSLF